jgi:hypothetical protein
MRHLPAAALSLLGTSVRLLILSSPCLGLFGCKQPSSETPAGDAAMSIELTPEP